MRNERLEVCHELAERANLRPYKQELADRERAILAEGFIQLPPKWACPAFRL